MKFVNLVTLSCAALTASAQQEWDDDYAMMNGDEGYDRERPVYDEQEKHNWIYGQPGDSDYDPDLSGEEIMKREEMWGLDLDMQKNRGMFQGWHRGFYKDYDWEMGDDCFSRTSVAQVYHIRKIFESFAFDKIIELQGLIFNLYFMFDHQCEIDSNLNDLANFCFYHDCRGEALLQNEMKAVFQVVGALNGMAAIYYEEEPTEDQHIGWFDRYNAIGLNIGKLMRYTLGFDPKAVREWDE